MYRNDLFPRPIPMPSGHMLRGEASQLLAPLPRYADAEAAAVYRHGTRLTGPVAPHLLAPNEANRRIHLSEPLGPRFRQQHEVQAGLSRARGRLRIYIRSRTYLRHITYIRCCHA